jgi:hypothetical protein
MIWSCWRIITKKTQRWKEMRGVNEYKKELRKEGENYEKIIWKLRMVL